MSTDLKLFIVPLLTSVCLSAGCQSDDIGKACGTEADPIGEDPVGGEEPVVEVNRIERDGACESFQCLTHRGLSPYCTRSCEFLAKAEDGKTDDCPKGFVCEFTQEVGPLSEQSFCVRKTCAGSFDCEDLGKVDCIEHACYDVCEKDDSCAFHQLECQSFSQFTTTVPCSCPDKPAGDFGCTDEELICERDIDPEPWSTITRQGYCIGNDE